MGLFTRRVNDWGDKEIKWRNVLLGFLSVAVIYLLLTNK